MEDRIYITTEDFVRLVFKRLNDLSDYAQMCEYGRNCGFLSEQESLYSGWEIDRRSVARISHEVVRLVLKEPESHSWEKAKNLKDLYDCRSCTKHIAEVYEKGIMLPKGEDVFGLVGKVSPYEAGEIIERIFDMKKRQH